MHTGTTGGKRPKQTQILPDQNKCVYEIKTCKVFGEGLLSQMSV